MAEQTIDFDRLALHLKNKIEEMHLSNRAAAKEIGFGATTLGRLLQGSSSENIPDLANVNLAALWLGRSLSDFSIDSKLKSSTISDVEVHLRALPGLGKKDVEVLVSMVRTTYEHAKKLRSQKR